MITRVATSDDFDAVFEMAKKFIQSTEYRDLADDSVLAKFVMDLLNLPATEGIVLIADGGMIAGTISPFVYGTVKLAMERAWWVEPDKRKTGLGGTLLETFEYWATANKCHGVIMVSLDNVVAKYYQKQGYKLREHTYMKEFN